MSPILASSDVISTILMAYFEFYTTFQMGKTTETSDWSVYKLRFNENEPFNPIGFQSQAQTFLPLNNISVPHTVCNFYRVYHIRL